MSFARELLHFPDLFPVRHSGERWGGKELELDLAGGPYVFRGLSEPQLAGLRDRYPGRSLAGVFPGGEIEIRVFRAPESDFRALEPRPWRDYPLELDVSAGSVRIASRGFFGRLAWRPGLCGALWTPVEEPLAELVGVFENFLRILVAYRLNELGGVLLHSAAVVHDREAYLFLGPSGAGKTTLARLSLAAGKQVLSDDMNLVLARGRHLMTEPLPFAGDLGQAGGPPRSYRVRGLFRLEKAARHDLHPAPVAQSLALLLASSPFLNADSHRQDQLLANLEAILATLPLRILAFSPDAGFWPLVTESAA